jgi:hypothetical protein
MKVSLDGNDLIKFPGFTAFFQLKDKNALI